MHQSDTDINTVHRTVAGLTVLALCIINDDDDDNYRVLAAVAYGTLNLAFLLTMTIAKYRIAMCGRQVCLLLPAGYRHFTVQHLTVTFVLYNSDYYWKAPLNFS